MDLLDKRRISDFYASNCYIASMLCLYLSPFQQDIHVCMRSPDLLDGRRFSTFISFRGVYAFRSFDLLNRLELLECIPHLSHFIIPR